MSEAALEPDEAARVMEKRKFWVRVSLVILILLCAGNIFLMLVIVPKFQSIFNDALGPDHPLPAATNFIIAWRIAIALATAFWPIVGAFLVQREMRWAILWINIGIITMFLQCGVTIIALFMPMVGDITALPDAKPNAPLQPPPGFG